MAAGQQLTVAVYLSWSSWKMTSASLTFEPPWPKQLLACTGVNKHLVLWVAAQVYLPDTSPPKQLQVVSVWRRHPCLTLPTVPTALRRRVYAAGTEHEAKCLLCTVPSTASQPGRFGLS